MAIFFQTSISSKVSSCADRAQFINLCNSTKEKTEKIRQLAEQLFLEHDAERQKQLKADISRLKRQLPLLIPMATFQGQERKKEQAILNGLVFADYDGVDDPRAYINYIVRKQLGEAEEANPALIARFCRDFGILLLKISAKGNGFHVVAKADLGYGGIEGNQEWLDFLFERTEVDKKHDEACKDPSRACFLTTEDDILFLSDELFTYSNPAFEEQFGAAARGERKAFTEVSAKPLGEGGGRNNNPYAKQSESPSQPALSQQPALSGSALSQQPAISGSALGGSALSSPSVPSDSAAALIPIVENLASRTSEKGNAPGNHNNTLYRVAAYMRAYHDDEQWLLENLPRYNQSDSEFRATVHSACQAEIPRGAKTLIAKALKELNQQQNRSALDKSNDLCPQLPADLPPLIAHISKNVPAHIKPAAIMAAMPALGAHCGRVKLWYVDNRPHYTALMSMLIAASSTGKSGQNDVVDAVMADVLESDRLSRKTLDEWKQRNEGKQTKDKEPKPRVPIRYLPANTTNASLWEAIGNVNPEGDEFGEFLFVRTDEVEALTRISNGAIRKTITGELSELIQFNYDSSRSGQHRVSLEAVNVFAPLKFNFVTACTPDRAVRFFRDTSVTDGCLSRLLIATIIEPDADELPVYGLYDEAWQAELKPYIDRLNAAQGDIRSAEVDALVRSIMDEQKEQADLASSEMLRKMLRREVKTAHRIAMLLYIAQGQEWDDRSSRFIRWIVNYGLWTKMRFFGNRGEEEIQREQAAIAPANTISLLSLLPEQFTRQQAINVRVACGKPSDPRRMLYMWKMRGHIDEVNENTFRKLHPSKK